MSAIYKMKKLVTLIVAILLIAALVTVALSLSVFGSENYIEIDSPSELKAMKSAGNYRLTADIALTDGTTLPAFSGKLDGNGKTISGLTAPLFEEVSGSISDLTLKGSISLTGKTNLGTLTNTLRAGGVIDGVTSEVTLSGNRPAAAMVVGGIVGRADTTSEILNCVNEGSITVLGAYNAENENAMGGIVGRISDGVIVKGCANHGAIYADGNNNSSDFKGAVGGIVGISNGTTYIENCLNAGEIKASYSTLCIAGILGRTETDNSANPYITNCVNLGNVTKVNDRGERPAGIASYVRGGNVTWCANLGTIHSNAADACGIIGYYNGSGAVLNLQYNYNAGEVKGYAIMRVNGMGNLKPVSNFYLNGKTACNEGMSGVVACQDKADLVSRVTALENSRFCKDMAGADRVNNGYPIALWQCTHAFDVIKDADKGEICSNCETVIREIDCDHSFGNWVIDKQETATEDGERHRVCSKCQAVDRKVIPASTSVVPDGGVYKVGSAAQLVWMFNGINAGTVPASAHMMLTANIDVDGKLPMLTTTFTGLFDGNGKTISGLASTLFQQFNGTVTDLTLRGDIDVTGTGVAHDTARKAASFALNTEGGMFENLVSYVNIKTEENDLNAGGLVGYARVTAVFTDCAYNGEYTVAWVGDGAGIGGIVGWSNASGGTTSFEGCTFGGKITVTGGASGKDAYIGGILGNCTNNNVIIRRCISNGTITSEVTTGNDYAGGILGINKADATVIEFSANKSSVNGGMYVGGILGGITANTKMTSCANYGKVIGGSLSGSLCGTSGGMSLNLYACADLSKSMLGLCGNTCNSIGSYAASKVTDSGVTFTLDGVKYHKYNFGFVEEESGIPVSALSTTDMFTPYISIRDEGTTHSVRFVILSNYHQCKAESVTVSINFKDKSGNTVKRLDKKLAVSSSDFTLYSSVLAGGMTYFAVPGNALFGCVITDIPMGAWESVALSIQDTASGTTYLDTVTFDISSAILTLDNIPDYSDLGQASAVYNCGPGLASDRTSTTNEDSYMTVISGTTAAKLAAYVERLPAAGYEFVAKNTLDGDTYYTYRKFGSLLYLYHNSKIKETRIIADNSSDLLSNIAYDYTKKAGDTTEFYQYSINYTGADRVGYDEITYTESGVINCGMCYIIKLPDNRLIMIDSGHEVQSTEKSRAGLLKFMRQITSKEEGEKVEIAMWFISHAHGDHVRLASDFINEYHEEIDLQAVTYNIPSYQVLASGYDDNTFNLKASINTYFPDTTYHKLHTGEAFTMAGVKFDVVYTHEDAVSAAGISEIGDFNATSTVLKITLDGKVLMLLGDISDVAENAIVGVHTAAYLKSDMVQVAHHCFNYLNRLYSMIAADIALFPQSKYNCNNATDDGGNNGKYAQVMRYATREYFAHKYTYKFTVVNGEVIAEALPRYDQMK